MGISRYAVISDDDYSFVTISSITGTSRKVVSCHNSIGGIGRGCKRLLEHLYSSRELCVHLQLVRDHLTNSGFDENDDTEIGLNVEILPNDKVCMYFKQIIIVFLSFF